MLPRAFARKVDGAWRPFVGTETFVRMVTTATVHRLDGSTEEVEVPPYAVQVQLAPTAALEHWSDAELAEIDLARVAPFVAPEGKVAVGPRRLIDVGGEPQEDYDLDDIPPPPPPPTFEERLAAAGLSLDELRTALGLDG